MSLILTEDELMLQDAIRTLVERHAPVGTFRALRDNGLPRRFSEPLWSEMKEAAVTAVLAPVDAGGTSFGVMGAAVIAEACGRTLAASPFLATSTIVALLSAIPSQAASDLRDRVASGALLAALAIDETARHDPAIRTVELAGEAGLSGRKRGVVEGGVADVFVVAARAGGRTALIAVPADADGVSVVPVDLIDARSYADVSFAGVGVAADAILATGEAADAALARALLVSRLLAAAELLGIAQEAFDRTNDYLRQRVQFGAPIGSFQALQHRAARSFIALEVARAVVMKAARAVDGGAKDADALVSLAKARLGETAGHVLDEAVQMHGGIAVTDEFDIGLFFKRARALSGLYGDVACHRAMLARLHYRI